MTMSSSRPVPSNPNRGSGQIGMVAAVSIGIGGMVGAGIFSILGVVAQDGRQCHVAGIRDRRRGGAAVHLFLRQARRHLPLRRRRGAFPGEEFRRRRARRRAEPVHVGGLHHLARPLRHGLRRLRRHLRDHHAVAAVADIFGGRRRRPADRGQCPGGQVHGPLRDRDRGDQGGDPGAVRRGGSAGHPARLSLARAVAGDQVDPVRRGRAVHRLRGLRPRSPMPPPTCAIRARCSRARSTPA